MGGAGRAARARKRGWRGFVHLQFLIKAPFVSLACNGLATGRIRRFCLSYHARNFVQESTSFFGPGTDSILVFTAEDDKRSRELPVYAPQAHEYFQEQLMMNGAHAQCDDSWGNM
jgi:hypothetical protein